MTQVLGEQKNLTQKKVAAKRQWYSYIPLFFLTALSLAAQTPPSAQADLALYRSNMERALHSLEKESLRVQQLLATPIQTLIYAYCDEGFTATTASSLLYRYYILSSVDEREIILAKCYEVAAKQHDSRLKRLANLLKAGLRDDNHSYNQRMEQMEQVVRSCRKAGDRYLETFTLDRMWKASFYEGNHARCFEYGARLIQALDATDDGYSSKYWGYSGVGKAYFAYKDYDRGAYYLKKALAHAPDMSEDITAMNTLASYYQMKGDLDSAAYYHRSILTKMNNPVHLQIAICNLGKIYQQKGDLDAAILLLSAGLEKMKKDWAIYDFIYGVYTSLGECMLAKGDLPAVREYIDQAKNGLDFPDITRSKRLKAIYALESNYYSHIGQPKKAEIYLDSALVMTQKHEEMTGKDVILLGEQRLKQTEINQQNERISLQQSILLVSLGLLLLLCAGLGLILYLYRKRDAAYKALARKTEEWATNRGEPSAPKPSTNVTQEDEQIMLLLDKEMQNNAYREIGLTAETLSDRLHIHRNALSRAINSTTGGNFNTYINGYRIKEAVRLILHTSHKELYIDELYEQVGFGSRSSFSRIFKQFTGLAPIEFQKQGEENSKTIEF